MVKFIHCADLHLGATFKNVARKCDGSSKQIIADSTLASWQKLVHKAVAEKVDFVLICGDIFDSSTPLLRQRMAFKNGIDKLITAGISCFVVSGNHDNDLSIFKEFKFAEQFKVFSADKVEKVVLDNLKTEIFGISYDGNNGVDNLTRLFSDVEVNQNYFRIAMLHANVGAASNYDVSYGVYSNCSLGDLTSKNFDYWALGHIHNGGILHGEKPMVVYSGSLQGLNINQDTPKGAYLVEVNDNLQVKSNFINCSTVDFIRQEVDLSDVVDDNGFWHKIGVLRDEFLKVHTECDLIFAELIFIGRSAFYSQLKKESESELINALQLALGDKIFINDISVKVASVIDKGNILKNNPLLGDILSFDESGTGGRNFVADKLKMLKNKFALLDFFTEEEIEQVISESKEELYRIFADEEEIS